MSERTVRRLTVLQNEAAATPVPTRKFFHVGELEMMEDVGECIPMIAWVDDNLSRYVLSDAPSSSWGRGEGCLVLALPNVSVGAGEGVFVVTGAGKDASIPHPGGKGKMHFVHLGQTERLVERGVSRLYVYKLEGVQVKAFKKRQ